MGIEDPQDLDGYGYACAVCGGEDKHRDGCRVKAASQTSTEHRPRSTSTDDEGRREGQGVGFRHARRP